MFFLRENTTCHGPPHAPVPCASFTGGTPGPLWQGQSKSRSHCFLSHVLWLCATAGKPQLTIKMSPPKRHSQESSFFPLLLGASSNRITVLCYFLFRVGSCLTRCHNGSCFLLYSSGEAFCRVEQEVCSGESLLCFQRYHIPLPVGTNMGHTKPPGFIVTTNNMAWGHCCKRVTSL